jgi:drug/metabolite transporter (DMT)-like permease
MPYLAAAVAAAIAINAGYVVQHRGLTSAPRIELRRPLAAIAALLRSRRWVAGAVLGYAGLGLEVLALVGLPLSAVQAAIGAGLVVVAVLSRALDGAPLGRAAPLGAALAIGALAVIAVVTPGSVGPHAAHAPAPWALVAAAVVVAAAAAMAARLVPTATGLALAAGLLYGMTSIAMAALAPMLAGMPTPLAVVAAAVAVGAVVTAAGFLSFQRALQRGRPLPVATATMAAMDLVAIAGGILLLGDPLAAGAGARAAQLAALALVALSAVVVLGDRAGRAAPRPRSAPAVGNADPREQSRAGAPPAGEALGGAARTLGAARIEVGAADRAACGEGADALTAARAGVGVAHGRLLSGDGWGPSECPALAFGEPRPSPSSSEMSGR